MSEGIEPQQPAAFAGAQCSAAAWACEWCGKPLRSIRGIAETEPGQLQAVGWCASCNAELWSKAVPKPPNAKLTDAGTSGVEQT